MKVPPLSPDEARWLRRLERVLHDMPARLLLVESGDCLLLVDRAAAKKVELADGGAREAGVVLADVEHGIMKVTGVSA